MLVLILTSTLMLYPIRLSDQYQLYEPANVFPNLGLFAGLFYAWASLLVLLLLTISTGRRGSLEGAALVAMFGLVFLGFWTLATPYGQSEELLFFRQVKSLEQSGRITVGDPTLKYNDWPGLALLATFASIISGLSTISVRTSVMLLNAFLIPLILFLIYRNRARIEMYIAALAVLLLVQSNPVLSISFFFRPENALGLILFLSLIYLLSRSDGPFPTSHQEKVMSFTLFLSLIATHFVSSAFVLVVWAATYMLYKRTGMSRVNRSFLLVAVVVELVWQLYMTFFALRESFIGIVIRSITKAYPQKEPYFYVFTLTSSNLGEQVPWWTRVTRLFWLVSVYGGGGTLAISNLLRFRSLDPNERLFSSCCVGVVACVVALCLAETQGTQAYRYIEYGGFFFAPTILLFLRKLRRRRRAVVFLVAGLLITLSFPSFLSHKARVSLSTYYPYDFMALDFVSSFRSEPWSFISLYVGAREGYFYSYYVPEARITVRGTWDVEAGGSQYHWALLRDIVQAFIEERCISRTYVLFQFTRNWMTGELHQGFFPPGHPKWVEFKKMLEVVDKTYDSQIVQFYA